MKKILIPFLAIALAAAAWKLLPPKRPHTEDVFVFDMTASIEAAARKEEFAAAERTTDLLQRGDELTLIPLTSDAVTETPGKILRFRVSEERKAFDADLKETKTQIRKGLEDLQRE